MFGTRWRLFRILGIPVGLDASWLIILALVTWTIAGIFTKLLPLDTSGMIWGLALATAVLFFICIVLHELGHAVVARVSRMPIRGITLFLFGGVAELEGEPPSARTEFLMAIAGPLVSVVLAATFWILRAIGTLYQWPAEVVVILSYLAWINTAVLIFNMVPAFPLDGGRVLRSILWGITGNLKKATRWASYLGQAFAWLLIFCNRSSSALPETAGRRSSPFSGPFLSF